MDHSPPPHAPPATQKHFLVLHSLPQKCTAKLHKTSCQPASPSLQCPQIEPGSLKNFAAQLKEGARTARFQRPQFFSRLFFHNHRHSERSPRSEDHRPFPRFFRKESLRISGLSPQQTTSINATPMRAQKAKLYRAPPPQHQNPCLHRSRQVALSEIRCAACQCVRTNPRETQCLS